MVKVLRIFTHGAQEGRLGRCRKKKKILVINLLFPVFLNLSHSHSTEPFYRLQIPVFVIYDIGLYKYN